MAEVRLQSVHKTYRGSDADFTAVKGISLKIADGEFIVLVGPSGCGKSTTLRMVAGLEEITDGTIRIGSRVVNEVAPADRDIAMVFQNYALYPHMTVYKNMAFGLKLRKLPAAEIDQRVRETAEILGITPLLNRKPKALSGGQRQRVAVGRAIVRDPAVFLFDEPLSNLDAKLRVETRAELKRLHKRLQTTTIYVTHDQEEAMTLGDRVVVMSEGVIQQCDTPLNVYQHPVNRFVAAFLGTPPMNFINGDLIHDGSIKFRYADGQILALTGHHAELLAGRIGSAVTLGIRPEALFLSPSPGADHPEQVIAGHIDVTEPLGHMIDAFVQISGPQRIVARVKAEALEEGQPVSLHIDPSKTHVFERGAYGENLTLQHSLSEAVEA